jgi:nitrous oxidase accessory protein NosD
MMLVSALTMESPVITVYRMAQNARRFDLSGGVDSSSVLLPLVVGAQTH